MTIRPKPRRRPIVALLCLLPLLLASVLTWPGRRDQTPLQAQATDPDTTGAVRLAAQPAWTSEHAELVSDLAWGDVDNDGDLDLIVATRADGADPPPNRLYLNDGTRLSATAAWLSRPADTHALVWADIDGDGRLDLVVGNDGANEIYFNQNGTLADEPGWVSAETSLTTRIAVGDLNQDGVYDLVAADATGHDLLYYGSADDGARFAAGVPLPDSDGATLDLALADGDGDGALDLLTISRDTTRLYRAERAGDPQLVAACPVATSLLHATWGPGADGRTQQLALSGNDPLARSAYTIYAPIPFADLVDCRLDLEARRRPLPLRFDVFPPQWADVNGDGILDLATARQVYLQRDSAEFTPVDLPFGLTGNPVPVAWGDVDGDGDLDAVAAAARQPVRLFLNESDLWRPVPALAKAAPEDNVLWGDFDGDGDFDRVRAPLTGARGVFLDLNQNGTLSATRPFAALPSVAADAAPVVRVFAWGDANADGHIDLAIATYGDVVQVYANDGQGGFLPAPVWQSAVTTAATDLAWGDIDRDGRLDLAVGTNNATILDKETGRDQLFRHNPATGRLEETPSWRAPDVSATETVRWIDVDQDGDLDLVAADADSPVERLYRNDNGALLAAVPAPRGGLIGDSAEFPLDGTARMRRTPNGVERFVSYPADPSFAAAPPLALTIIDRNALPLPLVDARAATVYSAAADPVATTGYYDTGAVTFFYAVSGADERAYDVVGAFSIDGGATWQPATPTPETAWMQLAPGRHTFTWDVTADGLTGRNDDVRFRLQARPRPIGDPLPGSAAGRFQQPFAQAQTLPFRVQGTWLRVVHDGAPVAGARVYHRSAESGAPARLLRDGFGVPLTTDSDGFLAGRPVLRPGDEVAALWPVPTDTVRLPFTDRYALYYSSAAPTETGAAFTRLAGSAVQTLPVSATHPLLLFDLVVALEWDARNDTVFQLELEASLQAASALLYDVSDGQIALGTVHVVHDKAYWGSADIVIHADNSLRPSAAIGGVVSRPVSLTLSAGTTITDAYLPGQIHMGTVWDPFGENTADLGVEWGRALAHELAHYLLFLPDNYLGFKGESGALLGRVDCPGSFMTTTSDPAYSEFLTRDQWTSGAAAAPCARTLAAVTTGRTDWETIAAHYPMLRAPETPLSGPSRLPLAVTQPFFWALDDGDAVTLPARNFTVRGSDQSRLRLPDAQAYLFRTHDPDDPTDDMLLPLGSPTGGGDRLKVRGGVAGDRLCLFDNSFSVRYAGCAPVDAATAALPVAAYDDGWQPDVRARAVTSRTVAVSVAQVDGGALQAQLFPAHYRGAPGGAPTATLQRGADGVYTALLTMTRPAFDVTVRVWEPGAAGREALTTFRLDPPWPESAENPPAAGRRRLTLTRIGNPDGFIVGGPDGFIVGGPDGFIVGGPDGFIVGGPDGFIVGGPDGFIVGGPDGFIVGGAGRSFTAPTLSADAQVVVYSAPNYFADTGVTALQAIHNVPQREAHPWLLPVGQAYRVLLSDTVPTTDRYIAFTYLQRDVPAGYEDRLALYFLADGSAEWQPVAGGEQFVENLIVGPLQGQDGIYAVMATITMPALAPGWNLIAYPLSVSRTVTQALASIAGQYDGLAAAEGSAAPPAVPTIAVDALTFGRVYWLHVSAETPSPLAFAPPRRLPDGTLTGD